MGSSSALCRKRSTACILLACALAVFLDISSMQSFLVGSAVYKPLSVLCRRGEQCMLRNSAKDAPGETISRDANRDVAVRHLEQWLLTEGREVGDATVQALQNVPPEVALTIIDGLWSAFTKKQSQEDVDASSPGDWKRGMAPKAPTLSVDAIHLGQRLRGVVVALPNFGGAFMDVGADHDVYLPASVLAEDTQVGDEMEVWVKEIKAGGKVAVTPIAPKVDISSLALGQKLHGVIAGLPEFGGAFLDVGAIVDAYIAARNLADGAKVGDEMEVWVKEIRAGGNVAVTPIEPKVDISSLALGQKLHGVIAGLPESGGAFLDVGAVNDAYIFARNLADGAKVGDELEVWVKEIRAGGQVVVTSIEPKVDISSLALGQKLHGVIAGLTKSGGAFLDVGAVNDAYIYARNLADGAKVGDEMEVWVKEIRADGNVVVTPTAPRVDISSLAVGDKLHGVITPLPKFGGAFVDVGAVTDVYIPASGLTEEVKAGEEADVWVKRIGSDGSVEVTQHVPEAHSS